jgi:hypothetical protein
MLATGDQQWHMVRRQSESGVTPERNRPGQTHVEKLPTGSRDRVKATNRKCLLGSMGTVDGDEMT